MAKRFSGRKGVRVGRRSNRSINNRIAKKKTVVVRNSVPIGLGMPRKMVVTHKYCQAGTVTCTSGVLAKYLFKCNGMYDPDFTGTGHQPIYFDQMSALYDHYCVVGSRIKVTFGMYPGNVGWGNFRVGLFVSDTNAPAGIINFNDIAEQGTSRWRLLTGNVSTGGMQSRTLRDKWSARKYFGKGVLANTDLQGTGSTDPTELSYYYLAVEPISDTVTESIQFTVEIDYIAVWKEVKPIGSS